MIRTDKVSDLDKKYWLDTVLGWAADRLVAPQFDECSRALRGWFAQCPECGERVDLEKTIAWEGMLCGNCGKTFND